MAIKLVFFLLETWWPQGCFFFFTWRFGNHQVGLGDLVVIKLFQGHLVATSFFFLPFKNLTTIKSFRETWQPPSCFKKPSGHQVISKPVGYHQVFFCHLEISWPLSLFDTKLPGIAQWPPNCFCLEGLGFFFVLRLNGHEVVSTLDY